MHTLRTSKTTLALGAVVLAFLLITFCGGPLFSADLALERDLHLGHLLEVLTLVKTYYVDPVDLLDMVGAYAEKGTINGMLAAKLDPFSRYLDARSLQEMQTQTSGEYSGIGIVITIKDERLTVVSPIAGTPGDEAGLRTGDHIVEIDGRPTEHMTLLEAVDLMRGPAGEPVELLIERKQNGETQVFLIRIVRAHVEVPAVSEKKMLPEQIGYIQLTDFNEHAGPEMDAALRELMDAGAQALILDLRGNPGGLLQSAVAVSDLFLSEGPIVHIVFRDGQKQTISARPNGTYPQLPLVVLVNEGSASASEIVAGCLKDHGLATVVGTTSFGKGLVQDLFELSGGAGLYLTCARYLTAGGHFIDKTGIEPDVLVKQPEAASDTTEVDREPEYPDMQLEKAIEILKREMASGSRKAA